MTPMTKKKRQKNTATPALKETLFASGAPERKDALIVEGLRQNNLKNLTLEIPHNKITVIVGPSGSGKSSLAFDTLFAEGRWRFMESLSTYTRLFLERMDRPELDAIHNIRPAIAVEQKNPIRTSRSTVGTVTELNDHLRLLFSRIGRIHCPQCSKEIKGFEPAEAADELIRAAKPEPKDAGNGAAPTLIGFTTGPGTDSFADRAAELLQKGFVKILVRGKLIDLTSPPPASKRAAERVDVIVDRVIIRERERARITDSIETAYKYGEGRVWVKGERGPRRSFSRELRCPACRVAVERPTPGSLSFNHPVGACAECKGFGNILKYSMDKIVPDKGLSLAEGAVTPWTKPAYRWCFEELERYAPEYGIDMDKPFAELSAKELALVTKGAAEFDGIDSFFAYLDTKRYKLHIKVFTSRYKDQSVCTACNGTRLKKTGLTTRVGSLNIAEVNSMSIAAAHAFFKRIKLKGFEKSVARDVLRQISAKLDFLKATGLGYLTLDRQTKTLSGGEAQRVQIATQLSASLTGVLYILDEPSIGLHPVDTDMLIKQLQTLKARANTIVVVEHDPSIIEASDHIVELGPGAGHRGGRLIHSGATAAFLSDARTLTAEYLTGRRLIHTPLWRRSGDGRAVTLKGASGNNLRSINIRIPLRTMTCVTGVSGSGKSSLIIDTLYRALTKRLGKGAERGAKGSGRPLGYTSIEGASYIRDVRLIDQGPIGRTPRSNPITYIGGFSDIRRIFASLPASQTAGLKPGHFSFNVTGGRCEACKGEGVCRLDMYFLPDVYVKCAACNNKRYTRKVLDVRYRSKNIFECLEMTFEEAAAHFRGEEGLKRRFSIIKEVGLGYLTLGQSATTLSGGEAQRLKIARELIEKNSGDVLYIFDEPTTGLHMDDIKRLLSVLGRLVDSSNTVIVIEHNLDCIKSADHIIDLGPGGGDKGGAVVGCGTPEEIALLKKSLTGRYLKEALSRG